MSPFNWLLQWVLGIGRNQETISPHNLSLQGCAKNNLALQTGIAKARFLLPWRICYDTLADPWNKADLLLKLEWERCYWEKLSKVHGELRVKSCHFPADNPPATSSHVDNKALITHYMAQRVGAPPRSYPYLLSLSSYLGFMVLLPGMLSSQVFPWLPPSFL